MEENNKNETRRAVLNRITIIRGDLTTQSTDAIVNAANSSLKGGGGVDGAIHSAGGPQILEECRKIISKIGRLSAGQAVITSGGKLPAKYVIHTVGPVYNESANIGKLSETLKSCYLECFKKAVEKEIQSIAFPSISTGAYRFPIKKAIPIALSTTLEKLKEYPQIEKVVFVLFDETTYQAYLDCFETMS